MLRTVGAQDGRESGRTGFDREAAKPAAGEPVRAHPFPDSGELPGAGGVICLCRVVDAAKALGKTEKAVAGESEFVMKPPGRASLGFVQGASKKQGSRTSVLRLPQEDS